jgi:hypothetical protein
MWCVAELDDVYVAKTAIPQTKFFSWAKRLIPLLF